MGSRPADCAHQDPFRVLGRLRVYYCALVDQIAMAIMLIAGDTSLGPRSLGT
jgi:hypothetical protein